MTMRPHRLPTHALVLLCALLLALLANLAPASTSAQEHSGSSTATAAFSCAVVAEIPAGHCEALVELFKSTDGPNWGQRTGWLRTNTPCSWYGVRCDSGRVVELNLYNNQLSGPLPASLGRLRQLAVLNLSNNNLTGSIPATLGRLLHLQELDLSVAGLSGSIPSSLGTLTQLRRLDLAANRLSGAIPGTIGALTALTELDLGQNQLAGTLPISLTNLASLESLSLYSNQLSGDIPGSIGNLGQLRKLNLQQNKFGGPLPSSIGSLTLLEELQLGHNLLSGTIPESLGNLPALSTLSLYRNRLSGAIPESLGNLRNMYVVDLHDNKLSGPVPESIVNIGDVYHIILGYNMLEIPAGPVRDYLSMYDIDDLDTQVVPPTNVTATAVSPNSVRVNWTPSAYQGSGGFYQVGYATQPGGPYTFVATVDKTATRLVLRGLTPSTTYSVAVRLVSPPHTQQHNRLVSTLSPEVSATTPAQ